MIAKVKDNIYCLEFKNFGSKVYLIKDKKILIDTSSKANEKALIDDLRRLSLNIGDIKIILLTHMHIDHIGNLLLFKNAKIYADKNEIQSIKINPQATTLVDDKKFISELLKLRFYPAKSFGNIKAIKSYGHTLGSLCYLYKGILFSGDSIFDKSFDYIGRTDLPTSRPELMKQSLEKLKRAKFNILCAGH